MRYKVGDKVVIRKDLDTGTKYYMDDPKDGFAFFTSDMIEFYGEQEISSHQHDKYHLVSDKQTHKYFFTDGMIDHVATAKLNEVKPKSLIKNGYIAELRKGKKCFVATDVLYWRKVVNFALISDSTFESTSEDYTEDLLSINGNPKFDIIALYAPAINTLDMMFNSCNKSNLIWERPIPQPEPKVIKMTSAELLVKLGLDGNTKIEIEG